MPEFKVYNKPCKNCLFTSNRIVSKKRADSLVNKCLSNDSYFVCHNSSMEGESTCCRKFFDIHKFDSLVTRMAQMSGIVKMVDQENDEMLPPCKD